MTCAGPQQTMKAAIKHMTIIDKFRISAVCLTLKIAIRFSSFLMKHISLTKLPDRNLLALYQNLYNLSKKFVSF